MTSAGAVRWEWDLRGVVTVVLDDPGRTANMVNRRHFEGMAACLDDLESRLDQLAGVVITSAKESFFSGPDVVLEEITPAENASAYELLVPISNQLRRLETLGRPVAAALVGSALGGGFEIALACHYRVGVNSAGIVWALAESGMGIMPGGGGVVRTARMFGAEAAVDDILAPGTVFGPESAIRQGIVDELATDRVATEAAAYSWVMAASQNEHMPYMQRWERPNYEIPDIPKPEVTTSGAAPAGNGWVAETRVADTIRAAAVQSAKLPVNEAFSAETESFRALLHDPAAGRMARLFADLKTISDRGRNAAAVERVTLTGERAIWVTLAEAAARAGFAIAVATTHSEAAQAGFLLAPTSTSREIDQWGVTVRNAGIEECLTLTLYPIIRPNPLVHALFQRPMRWVAEIGASEHVSDAAVAAVEAFAHGISALPVVGRAVDEAPAPIIARLVEAREHERSARTNRADSLAGVSDRILLAVAITARHEQKRRPRAMSDMEINLASILVADIAESTGGAIQYANDFPGGLESMTARLRELTTGVYR